MHHSMTVSYAKDPGHQRKMDVFSVNYWVDAKVYMVRLECAIVSLVFCQKFSNFNTLSISMYEILSQTVKPLNFPHGYYARVKFQFIDVKYWPYLENESKILERASASKLKNSRTAETREGFITYHHYIRDLVIIMPSIVQAADGLERALPGYYCGLFTSVPDGNLIELTIPVLKSAGWNEQRIQIQFNYLVKGIVNMFRKL